MEIKEVYSKLCYYDLRNPEGIGEYKDNPVNWGYEYEDFIGLGNFAKKDCACDNCFYGRTKLAEYIIELENQLLTLKQID
jgi:hypothetical protein